VDNFFSSQDFLMTWTDIKYIHAGQFSPTEKTCSVTLDQTIEIEKE